MHRLILKILLPFASNAKAHLCSLASNTNTLQTFFFSHFFFFIFGSDTGSTTPAFKGTNRSLHVPFSRFLPLQKGPTAPKKLASLHPALQLARQPFGSPRCLSHSALYRQQSGAARLALPAAAEPALQRSLTLFQPG